MPKNRADDAKCAEEGGRAGNGAAPPLVPPIGSRARSPPPHLVALVQVLENQRGSGVGALLRRGEGRPCCSVGRPSRMARASLLAPLRHDLSRVARRRPACSRPTRSSNNDRQSRGAGCPVLRGSGLVQWPQVGLLEPRAGPALERNRIVERRCAGPGFRSAASGRGWGARVVRVLQRRSGWTRGSRRNWSQPHRS